MFPTSSISNPTLLASASKSLRDIQTFDVSALERPSLGEELSFKGALEPATNLVGLFSRLSEQALQDFPDAVLKTVQQQSDAVAQIFESIKSFTAATQNPIQARDQIIGTLRSRFVEVFNALHPYISYSLHRAGDFQRLETESRATAKRITQQAEEDAKRLQAMTEEAQRALQAVKDIAAKGGVSAQAQFFETEATSHNTAADNWRRATFWMTAILFALSIATLFLHKHPFFAPSNTYDAIQLALSKILILGVAGYALVFCVKNYLGHRHNVVVNRHRQNALFTYTALVEATNEPSHRDAVLVHAASSIFSPQPTGYSSHDSDSSATKSAVEIVSRSAAATAAKQ